MPASSDVNAVSRPSQSRVTIVRAAAGVSPPPAELVCAVVVDALVPAGVCAGDELDRPHPVTVRARAAEQRDETSGPHTAVIGSALAHLKYRR